MSEAGRRDRGTRRHRKEESQKDLMPRLPPPASHLFFFLILFLLPPAHGPATWVPTLFGVPAPEAAQHDSPGGVRVQKQPQGPREHGREKESAGSGHGGAWGETGGIGVESDGRGGRRARGDPGGSPSGRLGAGRHRSGETRALGACCGLGGSLARNGQGHPALRL